MNKVLSSDLNHPQFIYLALSKSLKTAWFYKKFH